VSIFDTSARLQAALAAAPLLRTSGRLYAIAMNQGSEAAWDAAVAMQQAADLRRTLDRGGLDLAAANDRGETLRDFLVGLRDKIDEVLARN